MIQSEPMALTDVETDWIKEKVEQIDFLGELFPQQLLVLVKSVKPQSFNGNQTIIDEGQIGRNFFLIYNGRVSVWVERDGKRTKLASLKRGDYFGEISLLTGKPTTARVIAAKPTRVFFLDNEKFLALVQKNRRLANHIITVMKNRLKKRRAAVRALSETKSDSTDDINRAIKDFLASGNNGKEPFRT